MLLAGVNSVQNNFNHYLNDIVAHSKTLLITRKNKENVVVLSEKEYNELLKNKDEK